MSQRVWFVALLVVALSAAPLLAQTSSSTISYTSGPTADSLGTITANGSYSLGSGETIVGVVLYAFSTVGGQGGEAACVYDTTTSTWVGSITGMPAGTYSVVARLETVNSPNFFYLDAGLTSVTVPLTTTLAASGNSPAAGPPALPTPPYILYDPGQPTSPGQGKLSATGRFATDPTRPLVQPPSIIFYAFGPARVPGGQSPCQAQLNATNVAGDWGGQMFGLKSVTTFQVWARMTTTNAQGTAVFSDTLPTSVMVQ